MFIEKRDGARAREEILPFEMGYLTEFYQKKAEIELRDTPENREKGLKLMKEMAKKDKHMSALTIDDDFLLQYLRCRKYNVARAFSTLKAFNTLRRKNPEIFTNFRFETLSLTTRNKVVYFLPKRCQDGCAMLVGQLDHWNPEEFPVEELKRILVVILLQSLRDPMTQVNGFKVIIDVQSNPIRHLRYCTPSNLWLLYHGTQECVPGRFKEIHIVNNSMTFKAAWMLVKHFLTDKLKKRFFFHDGPDSLQDHFPRSVLPVQFNGDLEDDDMTEWLRKVTKPERLATLGGSIGSPS